MWDPKSYRPISLFCVPYKILDRLIYAYIEPLIDPLFHKEQVGFGRGKSTVDQVVLLTQNIEDSFEAKKNTGAVFVNVTAAYDTVWHRGLTCKLLSLLPDNHMVRMIMELVRNRSFTLYHRWQQAKQVTPFWKRRSSGIGLVSPSYLISILTIFLPWFPGINFQFCTQGIVIYIFSIYQKSKFFSLSQKILIQLFTVQSYLSFGTFANQSYLFFGTFATAIYETDRFVYHLKKAPKKKLCHDN